MLTCSQTQQNEEINSAANKLCPVQDPVKNSCNYCVLNRKLPLAQPALRAKGCGELAVSGCQVPTKPLYHPLPQQEGRRN